MDFRLLSTEWTGPSLTRIQLRSNIERALVSQQPRANFWLLHSLGEVHYNGLPFVLTVNRSWSLINQDPTAQTHIRDSPMKRLHNKQAQWRVGKLKGGLFGVDDLMRCQPVTTLYSLASAITLRNPLWDSTVETHRMSSRSFSATINISQFVVIIHCAAVD